MCGIGRVSSSIELVLFSCIRPFSLIVLGIYDSGFVQVYVEICWYMHDIVEYDIMFSACIKYSIVSMMIRIITIAIIVCQYLYILFSVCVI